MQPEPGVGGDGRLSVHVPLFADQRDRHHLAGLRFIADPSGADPSGPDGFLLTEPDYIDDLVEEYPETRLGAGPE